jgi:hypothetical protein
LPKLQPTNFWYQGILGIKWQHNKFQNDVVNLLYGVAIAFAIVALQKNGGALAINVSSEIQEERCKKSLSTSFKTSLLPTLVASMEEELLIALCDPAILSKYIFGIQWGPWYIKSRSLHWWELYYHKVINDNPIRFRRFFRVSARALDFLYSTLHDDLVHNPPHAFEVRICGKKLEVEKQVGISLRRLATGDSILTIAELFGVSITTVSKL